MSECTVCPSAQISKIDIESSARFLTFLAIVLTWMASFKLSNFCLLRIFILLRFCYRNLKTFPSTLLNLIHLLVAILLMREIIDFSHNI